MVKSGLLNPIQVARDGQQAIDYLRGKGNFADRSKHPLPFLVLLDLKLPYVTGLDVLKWIRQQPGLNPIVVMLTSSLEKLDVAAAYRLGANAYLGKTSDPAKLQHMVRSIHDFWLVHNVPPVKSPLDHVVPRMGVYPQIPTIGVDQHGQGTSPGRG